MVEDEIYIGETDEIYEGTLTCRIFDHINETLEAYLRKNPDVDIKHVIAALGSVLSDISCVINISREKFLIMMEFQYLQSYKCMKK